MPTRPYSATVTAGDDILATQYNNLRSDAFYNFNLVWEQGASHDQYSENGFNGDSNYVYFVRSTRIIYRLAIWPQGLFFSPSGTANLYFVSLAGTYTTIAKGIAIIGQYGYVWATDGSYKLVRIDLTNGNVTNMTISGTAPDNDSSNVVTMDGTDLYILDDGTTTLRKYSISGTTATYVTAITLSEAASTAVLVDSANSVIYFRANASANIVKNNMSGTLIRKDQALLATGATTFMGYVGNIAYIKYRSVSAITFFHPLYY